MSRQPTRTMMTLTTNHGTLALRPLLYMHEPASRYQSAIEPKSSIKNFNQHKHSDIGAAKPIEINMPSNIVEYPNQRRMTTSCLAAN